MKTVFKLVFTVFVLLKCTNAFAEESNDTIFKKYGINLEFFYEYLKWEQDIGYDFFDPHTSHNALVTFDQEYTADIQVFGISFVKKFGFNTVNGTYKASFSGNSLELSEVRVDVIDEPAYVDVSLGYAYGFSENWLLESQISYSQNETKFYFSGNEFKDTFSEYGVKIFGSYSYNYNDSHYFGISAGGMLSRFEYESSISPTVLFNYDVKLESLNWGLFIQAYYSYYFTENLALKTNVYMSDQRDVSDKSALINKGLVVDFKDLENRDMAISFGLSYRF